MIRHLTRKNVLFIVMACLCSTILHAQQYVVIKVVGNVSIIKGNSKQSVTPHLQLQASDIVNIGAYSMLELLDEDGQKKICIKKPGQAHLRDMMSIKENSIIELSKQYIDYIKSQVSNQRHIAMSDPATITMKGAKNDSTSIDMDGEMDERGDEPIGFHQMVMREYVDFRRQCIEQYVQFVRQTWKSYDGRSAEILPPMKEVEPVEYDSSNETEKKPITSPLPFDNVVAIEESRQPKPMTRIPEVPSQDMQVCSFVFYGTPVKIRVDRSLNYSVKGIDEGSVADALKILGGESFDNTIRDCLEARYDLQLGDWAYLLMLRQMAGKLYGNDTNEAVILTAYLYMQSGYKVRLASDKFRLYMLWASKHHIYGKNYYEMDGERYYSIEELPMTLQICSVGFPKEKSLSLQISSEQKFIECPTAMRTVSSTRYPEMAVSYHSNQNLMDFYQAYPTSKLGEDVMSRWAMYANTPMSSRMMEQIYPTLRQALQNCGEREAVERLLNWVQTGFEYDYDEKIWGDDRVFFSEESLFYPFCDCEDRSILFTRLVRDLCGLKCVLVYYPGHLAAAVAFTEPTQGDYIDLDGKHYTIADPTYIGAPMGCTMPGMDNMLATVILLK